MIKILHFYFKLFLNWIFDLDFCKKNTKSSILELEMSVFLSKPYFYAINHAKFKHFRLKSYSVFRMQFFITFFCFNFIQNLSLRFVLFTTVKQTVVIKWRNAPLEIKKYLNIDFVMESLIVLMSLMNRDALVSEILGISL